MPKTKARKSAAFAGNIEFRVGAPYGTRTRVTAVKGRCPGPLDEGRPRPWRPGESAARYRELRQGRQASLARIHLRGAPHSTLSCRRTGEADMKLEGGC